MKDLPLRSICKLSYIGVMDTLAQLQQLGDAWADRPRLIEKARQDNVTWAAIADALHMTRQGVVKLHATLDSKEAQS